MAGIANIAVRGLKKVTANINIVAANLTTEQKEALRKAAFIFEKEAKRRAPVDTGFLRANIRAEDDGSKVISHAEYSAYQEYGTSKMKAQPYMRPAARATRKKMLNKFGIQLGRDVKRGVR